jgi:RNA polymerase sigma factor (sigma-70 family)
MSTRINQHTAEQIDLADLYERHAAHIRAFIAHLTSDSDAAEDLCHDTFLKALRGWSGRRQTGSTVAWLYQIARNTAYDYLRRSRASSSRIFAAQISRSETIRSRVSTQTYQSNWQSSRHRRDTRCCCSAPAIGHRRSQ